MKPYSIDIRTKIVETKNKTNESTQQIANRFQVSYSFVNRLLKRYEVTKSVDPLPHSGGKPPLIEPQQLDWVSKLVEQDAGCYPSRIKRSLTRKNRDKSESFYHVPSFTKA